MMSEDDKRNDENQMATHKAVAEPSGELTLNDAAAWKSANGFYEAAGISDSAKNFVVTAEDFRAILPCAIMTAILYAVCFSGVNVFPQISFTLFCLSMCVILLITFSRMKIKVERKAMVWLIPIALLAFCNGVFDINIFSYGNVIFAHALFAVFTMRVINPDRQIWNMSFIITAFLAVVGNWTIAFSSIGGILAKNKNGKNMQLAAKIFVGILIAAPLLLLICALMLSSDQVFKSIFTKLLNGFFDWDANILLSAVTAVVVFIYAFGYIPNASVLSSTSSENNSNGMRADTIIGATVLILLNCLFLCFTAVQFAFLFSGGMMKLPAGLVYSDYARSGFFQLLFITVINFSVLIFFTGFLHGVRENKLLKRLLIMLCAFTGVLIASSFYRMYLYMRVYGFTPLRMCVITFLSMETLLIALTLIYFFKSGVNLLKSYLLTGLVFYIIVNVTGSNYFSTYMNIQRFYREPAAVIDLSVARQDGKRLINEVFSTPEFQSGEYILTGYFITRAGYIAGDNYRRGGNEDFSMGRASDVKYWQNWSLLKSE